MHYHIEDTMVRESQVETQFDEHSGEGGALAKVLFVICSTD